MGWWQVPRQVRVAVGELDLAVVGNCVLERAARALLHALLQRSEGLVLGHVEEAKDPLHRLVALRGELLVAHPASGLALRPLIVVGVVLGESVDELLHVGDVDGDTVVIILLGEEAAGFL